MNQSIFKISLITTAIIFIGIFITVVIPPFLENPNIAGAFAAGFVNPYSSGYSSDVICCWVILLFWVIYEYPKVKYGWLCLLIGIVPGVAVGFALYLLLRLRYLESETNNQRV